MNEQKENTPSKIKNLVFSGSGDLRSFAFLGALKRLEKEGVLENIEKVAGVSYGAVFALLLGLGYNPNEIEEILKIDFYEFLDGNEVVRDFFLKENKETLPGLEHKMIEDLVGDKEITSFIKKVLGIEMELELFKLRGFNLPPLLAALYERMLRTDDINKHYSELKSVLKSIENSKEFSETKEFLEGIFSPITLISLALLSSVFFCMRLLFPGTGFLRQLEPFFKFFLDKIITVAVFRFLFEIIRLLDENSSSQEFLETRKLKLKLEVLIKNLINSENGRVLFNIVRSMIFEKGLFKGEKLEKWIDEIVSKRVDFYEKLLGLGKKKTTIKDMSFLDATEEIISPKDITFKELHELKEEWGNIKDIYIVAVNVKTHLPEVFSYKTTPNTPISNAIRLALSTPFLFVPQKKRFRNEKTGKIETDISDDRYLEGSLIGDYPVRLFDDTGLFQNTETLGLKIVEEFTKTKIVDLKSFLYCVHMRFCQIYDFSNDFWPITKEVEKRDVSRTIFINTKDILSSYFELTEAQKEQLTGRGHRGVEEYLKRVRYKKYQAICPRDDFKGLMVRPHSTIQDRNTDHSEAENPPAPELSYGGLKEIVTNDPIFYSERKKPQNPPGGDIFVVQNNAGFPTESRNTAHHKSEPSSNSDMFSCEIGFGPAGQTKYHYTLYGDTKNHKTNPSPNPQFGDNFCRVNIELTPTEGKTIAQRNGVLYNFQRSVVNFTDHCDGKQLDLVEQDLLSKLPNYDYQRWKAYLLTELSQLGQTALISALTTIAVQLTHDIVMTCGYDPKVAKRCERAVNLAIMGLHTSYRLYQDFNLWRVLPLIVSQVVYYGLQQFKNTQKKAGMTSQVLYWGGQMFFYGWGELAKNIVASVLGGLLGVKMEAWFANNYLVAAFDQRLISLNKRISKIHEHLENSKDEDNLNEFERLISEFYNDIAETGKEDFKIYYLACHMEKMLVEMEENLNAVVVSPYFH